MNLKRSKFPSFRCRRIIFLWTTTALLLVILLHVRRRCCSRWGTPSLFWVFHFRSNWQKLKSSNIFCLFIRTAESSYWFYCWYINLYSNDQHLVLLQRIQFSIKEKTSEIYKIVTWMHTELKINNQAAWYPT